MAIYVGNQATMAYDPGIKNNGPQKPPNEIQAAIEEIQNKIQRIKGVVLPDLHIRLSSVLPLNPSVVTEKMPHQNNLSKLGNELSEISSDLDDVISALVYINDAICL